MILIWIVTEAGEIKFAVEEAVESGVHSGRPKLQSPAMRYLPKLGHPALVGCGPARIGGEIRLQEDENGRVHWELNNRSGRYGLENSRTSTHLENVRLEFEKHGIELTSVFVPLR